MSNQTILTSSCLSDFFYQGLSQKNKVNPCPLPEEFIFYSSLTLEKYAFSENYFEMSSGKVNQKILGMRYLESGQKSREEKISELKDIGDTVLVLLGFFSESVNKKIISREYYLSIARNAYSDLSKLNTQFYDIPNFYNLFSSSLQNTISLLEGMAQDFQFSDSDQYLLNIETPHKEVV